MYYIASLTVTTTMAVNSQEIYDKAMKHSQIKESRPQSPGI
jgi:hypothetical protein